MKRPLEVLDWTEKIVENHPNLTKSQRDRLCVDLERAYYSYTLVDIARWNAEILERFAELHRKLVG